VKKLGILDRLRKWLNGKPKIVEVSKENNVIQQLYERATTVKPKRQTKEVHIEFPEPIDAVDEYERKRNKKHD
jgi:hypothetical protein